MLQHLTYGNSEPCSSFENLLDINQLQGEEHNSELVKPTGVQLPYRNIW